MKTIFQHNDTGCRRHTRRRWGPTLALLFCAMLLMPTAAKAISGTGTSSNPYTIGTLSDLNAFRTYVNNANSTYIGESKYWKVTADIDASGSSWVPIGTITNGRMFTGIFDGNGKTITVGSYINQTASYIGFFSQVTKATIKNLTIKFPYFDAQDFVGGLVGEVAAYPTGTTYITNCHTIQTNTTYGYGYGYGGLVGQAYQGTLYMEGCSHTSGKYMAQIGREVSAGGLIGKVSNNATVSITDCMAQINFSGSAGATIMGGLVAGVINTSNLTMTRVAFIGTMESAGTLSRAAAVGYIGSGSSATIKRFSRPSSSSPIFATLNGTGSCVGSLTNSEWLNSDFVYNQFERTASSGTSYYGQSTRGNERWGYNTSASPQISTTAYAVCVVKGTGIATISGARFSTSSTYYHLNAGETLTITPSSSVGPYQRMTYTYTPYYSPSTGASHSASTSGTSWILSPRADGRVSAVVESIPFPYVASSSTPAITTVFDQWTSTLTISGKYNNPSSLSGKFYLYKRQGTSGGWSRDAVSVTASSGSNKDFNWTNIIAAADLEKSWQYRVIFVEGTSTTPPTNPEPTIYGATASLSTVTFIDMSSFNTVSREDNVSVSFTVDNRLTNNASYKYTIQTSVNGGAFTDWVTNQSFDGRDSAYTHLDNRMTSSCDIYTYRLVITAFGRTFTSETKTGSKTGATKFDDTVPFKASKGEYANYVRLQWKVDKSVAGSSETFRVFRRVANTNDAYTELEVINSASPTVYWNDNNALTGVYYEYKVNLYQVCAGVESYSAERTNIGFTQAFGTVSGRVTYGTSSNAVKDVNMLVRRNALQTNESQYRSLKSTGGNQKVEWTTDSVHFNSILHTKNWTLQFWVNPNGSNTGTAMIGSIGEYSISLIKVTNGYQVLTSISSANRSEVIPANRFSHITIVREANNVKIYTVCDQDPDSIYIVNKSFSYTLSPAQTKANSKISFGHALKGNIDDIRFWTRSLSEANILSTYDRMIVGNETGLKFYWTFDENLAGYAFDRSRVGTVYNGNHATTNTLTGDSLVPNEKYQLALKATTDANGNYQINGIPYTGEGSSYSIVPSMGVHTFNPQEELRYISPTSMVHNGTNFSDISSFKVKGKVIYEGGTYPVEGCSFSIDGQPITSSEGVVYKSNALGEFEIEVPIGIHEVKVQKTGHTFADGGLLLDAGANINYNKPLSNITFYDQTRVKLIGRVVGGSIENDVVLGFGESKNNIGVKQIILENTRKEYDFSLQRLTKVEAHNHGEWRKPNALSNDSTTVIYSADSIIIRPSATTGEFAAWVYPELYTIGEIRTKGANNTMVEIYTNRESLDLKTAAVPDSSMMQTLVRSWVDSVYVSRPGVVDHFEKFTDRDTIHYHAKWTYYYQATPSFNLRQTVNGNDVAYFGERSYVVKDNVAGTSDTLALWNGTTYLFNAPLFVQGQQYGFRLKAYERYFNYEKTPVDTTTYPVANGTVSMANTIASGSKNTSIALDSTGVATYRFKAGAPDLTTAQNNFYATVKIGTISYLWDLGTTPISVWHIGEKSTGIDFMTSGPDELTTILRDPPGSASHAYIESGSSFTTATTNTLIDGVTEAMNLTTSLGPKITTFVGLGAGVITEAETKIDISAGLKSEQTWEESTEKSTTTTFTERFETSSDPLYVGSLGDVFIGNSTNIQYGLTNGIQIRRGAQDADTVFVGANVGGNAFNIIPTVGMAYGQTFATRFAFTQVELEEVMIPKWQNDIRLRLLAVGTNPNVNTITAPVYVSKLAPSHANYGKANIDRSAFPTADLTQPFDGQSYQIFFPTAWTDDKKKAFQDSIVWANNQINMWETVLAQNEEEKVGMTPVGNYSFGPGASIENSRQTTTAKTMTSSFMWVLNPTVGGETGGDVMGIGLNLKVDFEYKHENTAVESETEEQTMTVGFVLAEEGDDDQLTVDYGTTASGTFAFKLRGGRTSCPHEAPEYSKYYQPGQHVLSEGSAQIEVPKIDVSSAPAVLNVPSNRTAAFTLALKNESETGEDVWFQLIVDESTNPHGAELKIDGGIIGNGRNFLVPAGRVLTKTLTVGKGTVDNYHNIKLILRSQCQSDPTDFLPDIADTTAVSVEFVPGCSDVRIRSPYSNWIVNTGSATGDTLYVNIDNFDVTYPNFGYIRLEYRQTTSPLWNTITTFYPSQLYPNAQGVKENIGTRSTLVYPWVMPNADGAYELRATSYAVNIANNVIGTVLSSYSTAAVAGYKDMRRPTSLGAPSPASGIMAQGDELSITFNEEIQSSMLTNNNFSITGVLNEQPIAEPNVGLAFTGTQVANTEMPIYANGSFSIETWFRRDANSAGTLFAYGTNNNYISLGFNATGNAVISIGNESYTSVLPVANDATWKYIAMVFDREANTVSLYEYEGALTQTLFTAKLFTTEPETQGRLFVGNNADGTNGFAGTVAQLHFYNTNRTGADVTVDKSVTKSGRERGLIGYWKLDEAEGNTAKDKARGRDLFAATDWYIYPSGRSMQTNGSSTRFEIPTATYGLDVYNDFTLEFWFNSANTTQRSKTLLSTDNGSIGVDAAGILTLYKANGSVNQVLTTNNLIDTKWHHIALSVKRNGNANVYIDGVNTATFAETQLGSFASGYYYFGAKRAASNTYSQYFAGNFDEVRIWGSALTRESILLSKNSKLNGTEPGLQAYYPFEMFVTQSSGIISVQQSNANVVDAKTTSGNATFATVCAPVKNVSTNEAVPFTFLASSNKVVFTLDNSYFSRVEGVTLSITAAGIKDLRDNTSNVERWTAYINRNALLWDTEAVDIVMEEGSSQSFTARITNTGGATVSYAIDNLPSWLSVSSATGNLQPLASKTLTFTVFNGINIGNYEASVTLTSGNGVDEMLPVKVKVTGQRPTWTVNPYDFESTMTITGRLQIVGINQEDAADVIAAFVGDTCLGIASPRFVPEYNGYYTFMTVYGNAATSGRALTFKLWDASTGRIYSSIESKLNNAVQNIAFVANAIHGNAAAPIVHNALNVIEQQFNLQQGWNWVSFNVESSTPSLFNQFRNNSAASVQMLKGQTGFVQRPNWAGSLSSLDNRGMYMVNTNAASVLRMNGQAVNPATTPVTLTGNGWTWIGYTPQFTLPVSTALAGLNPQIGDQIKGHFGYRTYMGANGWVGSLDYMRPGEGYMYFAAGAASATLVYPSRSTQHYNAPRLQEETDERWSFNRHAFPSTMTVTANLLLENVLLQSGNVEIAAFVGTECRGTIMMQDVVGMTNPYMGFLMIFGENNDRVTFRVYNHLTGREYIADNVLTFANDAIYGNPEEPYLIAASIVGNDSFDAPRIDVYPNPAIDLINIVTEWETIERLEVCDVAGRAIMSIDQFNAKTLNVSSLEQGIYLLKLQQKGRTYIHKFTKK